MATASQTRVLHITEASFQTRRDNDTLEVGYYAVTHRSGVVLYAFSPDGIGCIWYNTREDMINGIPAE